MRLLYTLALLVQLSDVYHFITLSRRFWPRRADLAGPTSAFFLRAYCTLLLPYILLCYWLRHYHVRDTDVGQAVAASFALFHALAPAWYAWSWWTGGYVQRPMGIIMAFHVGCVVWAGVGWGWAL
ncbi:hypothetical protein DFP73DRAFT_530029 [Morchella snyderi]|nr:hypothetical protein DFP73DRAFT_530029 [Morchella snyderi]